MLLRVDNLHPFLNQMNVLYVLMLGRRSCSKHADIYASAMDVTLGYPASLIALYVALPSLKKRKRYE
jgi:hypothetical protein